MDSQEGEGGQSPSLTWKNHCVLLLVDGYELLLSLHLSLE